MLWKARELLKKEFEDGWISSVETKPEPRSDDSK